MADAADQLDAALRHGQFVTASEHVTGAKELVVFPLKVRFDVREKDNLVVVFVVWHVPGED